MRTLHRCRSISDFPYTPLAAALALALASQAAEAAKNIVVDDPSDLSTFDSGTLHGTLRGALTYINANCSGAGDKITFFANGPFVTTASSDLPTVSCSGLTIDGGGTMSSPGAALFSATYGSHVFGLNSNAGNAVTVKGMEISGWTYGTGLAGHIIADNNSVHNNSTGIDSEYTDNKVTNNAVYSNCTGIWVAYGGQTITGNNIYSNSCDGLDLIAMTGGAISNNTIGIRLSDDSWAGNGTGIYAYGNRITLDANVLGANSQAMYVDTDLGSTITSNNIGGTGFGNDMGMYLYNSSGTTFSNNILSNTYGGAVEIAYGANVTLSGNRFGSDSSGNAMIGNDDGITVDCSSNVSIQGNQIVNWYGGTGIQFNGVTGGGSMDIVNNKINVTGNGVASLGGMSYGIVLRESSCGSTPLRAEVKSAKGKKTHARHAHAMGKRLAKSAAPGGATTNLMISGNTMRNVSGDGILVNGGFNSTITSNTIMDGSGYGVDIIFGNGIKIVDNNAIYGSGAGKNVSLVPGPVYHNTSGVLQPTVPNDGQDAPTITSITPNYTGGNTLIAFTLHGPIGSYEVQACQNNPTTTVPGCSAVVGSKTVQITTGTSVATSMYIAGTSADYLSLNSTSLSTNETSEFSEVLAITPAPAATYVPTTLDFGNVGVNFTSVQKTATITSTGSTPYVITSMSSPGCEGPVICYGGSFSCSTTCVPNSNYNPTRTCTITATFMPTTTGTLTTTIGICDNVYGGTITLTGTGVPAAPVTVDPGTFDFGEQLLRVQGPPETFTVTNPTIGAVTIGDPITSPSDFVVVNNNCPSTIAPNSSCTVDVAFNPQSKGVVTGVLAIPSGALVGSLQVKRLARHKAAAAPETAPAQASLSGTGISTAILQIPDTLDLGAYTSGDPPNTKGISLTNNGNAVLSISSISVAGPFTVVSGCPPNLDPGATCSLVVSYSASDFGQHTGTLTIVSNAADNGASVVALTAMTVSQPTALIRVSPAQIGFGDRLLGTDSDSQRITITNIGNAAAAIALGASPTDYLVSASTCTGTLAPATSCYADVVMRPVGFGPRVGVFEVDSNAQGSPFTVTLGGSGCRPYSAASVRLGSSFRCAP